MVYSRTEHTPLLNGEPQPKAAAGVSSVLKYVAAACFVVVGVIAVTSQTGIPMPMLGEESVVEVAEQVADSSASGSLSSAEAARRTAAAASALAKQTMINAKDSKELADAVYAEAQAEAEKLEKLAIQARKDATLASDDNTDANAAATSGIEELENQALAEDTTLTATTQTYEAARATYQASTDLIVVRKSELDTAKANTATAQKDYDDASAAAAAAKEKADTLSVAAADLNAASQADSAVGEEEASSAIERAQKVADAAQAAKTAEIAAADAKELAADKLNTLNEKKLLQKTAQETLDAEIARNKVLAAESNQKEQDMIEQSHVTALAKTAAADAKKVSHAAFFNASATMSSMDDAASMAEEAAAKASTIARTRDAEAKAATAAYKAAVDANEIAQAQLALAERTVEVEEKRITAAKNAASVDTQVAIEAAGPTAAPGPAASTTMASAAKASQAAAAKAAAAKAAAAQAARAAAAKAAAKSQSQ